ncbi:Zinc knuckle [Carex littledalei]|uniref:Zinc knuckle n=1 Tax=Carex littledalei TaxID=544730 RepID=A0A833V2S8_9POAL|nr:Zinc knuckle [Carex littledalei]
MFYKARLQATLQAISDNQHTRPLPTKLSYAAVTAGHSILARDLKAQRSKQTQGATVHTQGVLPLKPSTLIKGHTNQRELQKTFKAMKKKGRCFKCLEKGHNKSQCKNAFKCHKCQGIGHQARRCTLPNKSPTTNRTNQRETQHQTHSKPPPDLEKTNNTMNLDNWETVEMISPEYVNVGREDDIQVFMPARTELRPANAALARAAIVMTANLAMYFNRHPHDFKVRKVEPTTGDFIAIFPTIEMRNEAVEVGAFVIDQTTDIQLVRWTPARGMARVPVSHRAYLKLVNVPLAHCNWEALDHIVSGFGYLLRMSPVQEKNGNYEELKILIACHNPVTIPHTMLLTEAIRGETYAGVITIELDGWLLTTNNPNPPDVDEEQVDEALSQNRNRLAERRRQRGQAAPRHARRQRTSYQTDGSSYSTSWRVSGPYCIKNPPSCVLFFSKYRANGNSQAKKGLSALNQKIFDFDNINYRPSPSPIVEKVTLDIESPMNLGLFQTEKDLGLSQTEEDSGLSQTKVDLGLSQFPMEHELDLGLSQTETHSQTEKDSGEDSEGPLPEEKNTGGYISTIAKAQLTQGFSASTGQASTPKNKPRIKKPVKLTYLESHDPLSPSQAEVVVSIAGVELGQELTDKIRKFLPNPVTSTKESA